MDSSDFEYKANVRKKVKQIETRLSSEKSVDEEINPVTINPKKHASRSNFEPVTSTAPVPVTTSPAKSIRPTSNTSANHISKLTQRESAPAEASKPLNFNNATQQKKQTTPLNTHEQLNKHPQPQLISGNTINDSNNKRFMNDHNFKAAAGPNQDKIPIPPKPLPRKIIHRQSLPNVVEMESEVETVSASASASNASTRRSSEDDGIADMALESDPFDDSTMPLPKIKDNAFLQKDSRNRSDGNDSSGSGPAQRPNVLPLGPRRASLIPTSSIEKRIDEHPKPSRTRTDSTNSAENFVVRKISTDLDDNRRASQADVKIDVLQSIGTPELHSPIRSPVIVRSTTLSNSAASILVLGLPDSGKSATIDALVQHRVAETGKKSTPEIVEYTAKIKILDSSNLFSLKIIEVPGYTNDPTISADASLMTTMVSYLDSKEGLRGKPPTIVLVVFRFDDKRLWNPEDEHPDIVNFLKLLHNFHQKLNDSKHANFVFVLTHLISGNATEQEQRKPQTKIIELINLIQKYTSLPLPIMVVCAENRDMIKESGQPQEMPHSLAVSLPNGETYPYNLIDKIKILLTKKGRDSVGETVLRTAFGIEYPYSIKECRVTQRIPLLPVSHSTVQQMQKNILHAYMDIERTEIFTLLEIGWENIDPKIRDKFPDSLYTVQQIFQTKQVNQFADIPEDPSKVLNLVRQMPSNLAVKDLLIDTLQLKVPACYPALYIGQGFDLVKDTTTVSPFQLASSGFKTSPIGLIPTEFDCKIRDDREICFKFFYTVEEYILERLKDMNLRYSISPNSLSALSALSNASQRWGYNHIKKNQEPTKSTVATAVIEYRVFQLTLHQQAELKFKPQFWESVKEIPDLDIKDATSVLAWREFFGYWGTHIVKSAFGGGSVEITFRGPVLSKIFNSMRKDFILPSDEYETTKVFQWITGDGLDFVACGKDIRGDFLQGYDVEASFHGGDIRFQQVDLTKVESKERVADIREEWKESLALNPVMLETHLVLVPLSHYVRDISEGIATKIDVALHYFYSDFMVSQGKQSSCTLL